MITKRASVQPEVRRVILFGSRARGEEKPDSDFDFCLVVDEGSDIRSLYVRLMREIASADWSVDLMILTEKDYGKRLEEGWSVMKSVARDGKIVYAA